MEMKGPILNTFYYKFSVFAFIIEGRIKNIAYNLHHKPGFVFK